jgi:predicted nucleic acid-binding protein
VNFRPVYLDTSALVKLVSAEPESAALLEALEEWPDTLSSALARVELHRALWRAHAPEVARRRAEEVLSALVLVRLDDAVLRRASSFRDPQLRSLDALHLATALSIGDDPEAFVTYDARLAAAARRHRLHVAHPGVQRL